MTDVTLTLYGDAAKAAELGEAKARLILAMQICAETKKQLKTVTRTGLLANSYMWKVPGQFGGWNDQAGKQSIQQLTYSPKSNEAYVGANVSYALYREMGTRHMAPFPAFRAAIAVWAGQKALATIAKAMQEEIEKGVLKLGQKRTVFF